MQCGYILFWMATQARGGQALMAIKAQVNDGTRTVDLCCTYEDRFKPTMPVLEKQLLRTGKDR